MFAWFAASMVALKTTSAIHVKANHRLKLKSKQKDAKTAAEYLFRGNGCIAMRIISNPFYALIAGREGVAVTKQYFNLLVIGTEKK